MTKNLVKDGKKHKIFGLQDADRNNAGFLEFGPNLRAEEPLARNWGSKLEVILKAMIQSLVMEKNLGTGLGSW